MRALSVTITDLILPRVFIEADSPAQTSTSISSLLTLLRSQNAGLPSSSIWNKIKGKGKEVTMPDRNALARPRYLTLAFGDMETIRMELEAVARDWTKPPPDVPFTLRVPIEYVAIAAALTGEDSYQIALHGVQGLRVEIISDAPPPPDEPPPPPPPPVLEMPGTFNLELSPGQHVALDVNINSDELDMARMEDGTLVDGMFWGKLDIIHAGDDHSLEFTGTRLPDNEDYKAGFRVDSRVMTKLAVAAKPVTAKCVLTILAPAMQYCDVVLSFSPLWQPGVTWPPAEKVEDNKIKYFLRAHPGGALEHFENETVTTALYYEAVPDPGMVDPNEYIAPRNGFAMSLRDFIPHLTNVLDQLGLSVHARTNFLKYIQVSGLYREFTDKYYSSNMGAFAQHKNIAYRFLSQGKIASAIDIAVTTDPCVFTRLFLIFRGLTDDEVGAFAGATEKEANSVNWREIVDWQEDSKDPTLFRILETSVLEVT
ncbi:hypothetical protein H0H93_004498 [Arthromyces matolae]|nr:hypothetical protein H0H93_004498 [Arthromyces matolae]